MRIYCIHPFSLHVCNVYGVYAHVCEHVVLVCTSQQQTTFERVVNLHHYFQGQKGQEFLQRSRGHSLFVTAEKQSCCQYCSSAWISNVWRYWLIVDVYCSMRHSENNQSSRRSGFDYLVYSYLFSGSNTFVSFLAKLLPCHLKTHLLIHKYILANMVHIIMYVFSLCSLHT